MEIEDIATADFEEALKGSSSSAFYLSPFCKDYDGISGVWGIVHVAAPLPGRVSLDQMIQVYSIFDHNLFTANKPFEMELTGCCQRDETSSAASR